MTARPPVAPSTYEVRIGGHLDERWATWFDGLALTRDSDGSTLLSGPVTDQAALHGLLARVRDLGAVLISVRNVDANGHDGAVSRPLEAIGWPRRTDRLVLRRATPHDVEATWQFRRLDEVSRWITRAPATLEEYRTRFEDPASLAVTIVVELDGVVVGDLMLRLEDAWAQAEVADRARGVQAELGWVLHPDHAGHGYATEAVRELIRICFEDLGLRRVTAECFADNVASWRLMERLGMRRESHTIRDSLHRSDGWLDGMAYALLAEDWRGAAERPQP